MKLKITCDYCSESIVYDDSEPKPKTCVHCNSFIDHLQPVSETDPVSAPAAESMPDTEYEGLELICQKTGAVIKINHASQTVIGRESAGREILSAVAQISRKHAQIDFENGCYVITDLGSTNGTFIGVARIDCKIFPKQNLGDGELLFLGKEPFLVRLIKKEKPEEKPVASEKKPTKFKCASCGTEFTERTDICPQCGSYGSLNPAY